jgi:site-specific DNA-methyltransferase (adenine-specific)
MWVYGSGFPKSHNLKGEREGWGTALKPAWEPIILARKPLEGTVAANVLKWGTGAINIDGCRVETSDNLSVIRSERPLDTQGMGWGFKAVSRDNKGRWPANLIHDGSGEVMELFPESKSSPDPNRFQKTNGGWGSQPYGNQVVTSPGDSGSAARFFYTAKASRSERDAGCEGMDGRQVDLTRNDPDAIGCNNPHNRGGRTASNFHPCVKPLALMRYLCRLITPPNGTILDPFMGSGTTGMAAQLEGFRFVGIEKEKEYAEIAERRIAATARGEAG